MKHCKKCNQEKRIEEFVKQLTNNKYEYKNICKICYNKRKVELSKLNKKLKIKTQYKNCNIIDNNRTYSTNNLSENDIIELKESGYEFIFK